MTTSVAAFSKPAGCRLNEPPPLEVWPSPFQTENILFLFCYWQGKKKQKERPKRNSPKIIWRLKNVCLACLAYSLRAILNTNVIAIFLRLRKRKYSSLLSKYRKNCHFHVKHLTGNRKVIYLDLSCNIVQCSSQDNSNALKRKWQRIESEKLHRVHR